MENRASPPSSDLLLIVRNALSAYGLRGLLGASVLVLTPFLFRELGAGGFGTWSVIFSVATTFSLVELGFGRAVSKITAELLDDAHRREREETIGAAVTSLAGLGVLAALSSVALAMWATGLAAPGLRHDFRLGLLVLGAERLIAFPLSAYGAALLGYQRYDLNNIGGAVQTLSFTVAAIAVVEAGSGVLGVTVVFSASHLVSGLLSVVFLQRVDPELSLRPRRGNREKR
ncbi:MAG: hypothetical protein QOF43_2415, partial [Gaiellaceae bacterium]|nr:hypothetical protein [Gaiellaceae bacterium]